MSKSLRCNAGKLGVQIIPQIEAEIKKGRKPKTHDIEIRTDPSGLNEHPGRQAFMDATGATSTEALQIKSIHDKAPELLARGRSARWAGSNRKGGSSPCSQAGQPAANKPLDSARIYASGAGTLDPATAQ
jgi:hypothetical protein